MAEETGAAQGCTTASSSSSSSFSSNSPQDNCDYSKMLSASHLVYYVCQPSLYRLHAIIFNDSESDVFLCLDFSDCDVPCRLENKQVENFFSENGLFWELHQSKNETDVRGWFNSLIGKVEVYTSQQLQTNLYN